jgi:acetylornithine deacetylase/succinyl-diaminopimelate desuccinylase-like protein
VPERWQEELAEFIRIPSVSADPAHADDVTRAAEWVRDLVRAAGGEAELVPWGEQPLVIGELRASSGADAAPTVLVYGHFDVQPPAPLDEWESDPFELTARGEWLYGRGIADDKGQLYALLKAAAELATEGDLPVNIRVACDGEEEIGGHSIVDFLAQDGRGADACVIFDGGMQRRDRPEFFVGTRGLVGLNLTVRAGARDLHSGLFGGVAMNAIHALAQTLEGVLPRDGRLPEPLRQGIAAPSDEEVAAWAELPAGAEELEQVGAVSLDPRAAAEFYRRTWAEPSADVTGIIGGKPGLRNTTISAQAKAQVMIRIAPGQDVDTIRSAALGLLEEHLPEGATLEWEDDGSSPPGLVPPDAPAVRLGLDAFERAFGTRPILVRSGGTLPIVAALGDRGIPSILSGVAWSSNIHSPNERLLADYVPLAIRAAREVYVSLGSLSGGGR